MHILVLKLIINFLADIQILKKLIDNMLLSHKSKEKQCQRIFFIVDIKQYNFLKTIAIRYKRHKKVM